MDENQERKRVAEGARPRPVGPGWTEAPFVSIPRIDNKHDLPPITTKDVKVRWLPAPKVGHVALLGLLYSEHGELRPAEASGQDIRDFGYLDLRNGERVWVTHSEKEMEPEAVEDLCRRRELLRVDVKPGTDLSEMGGSLMFLHNPAGGEVAFTEIVLGRHLFHHDDAKT